MRFPIIRESVRAGGQERQAYVYTVTEAEYMEKFRQEDNRLHLLRFSEKVRHCKVDIFEKFAHGTIAVPAAGDPDRNGQGRYIRFYMDGEKLILIGETSWTEKMLDGIFDECTMPAMRPYRQTMTSSGTAR